MLVNVSGQERPNSSTKVCVAAGLCCHINSRAALTHLITWSESSDSWLVKLCVLDWFHQTCRLGPLWNDAHDFSPQMLEIIYKYAALRQDSDRWPGPLYVIPAGIKESDSSHSSDSQNSKSACVVMSIFLSDVAICYQQTARPARGGEGGCWWWTLAQLNSLLSHLRSGEQKAVQASAFSSLTASISSCSKEGGSCAPTVDDHISVLDLWRTRSQQVDTMLDTLEAPHDLGSLSLRGKELVLQPAGHWFKSSDGAWVGVPISKASSLHCTFCSVCTLTSSWVGHTYL